MQRYTERISEEDRDKSFRILESMEEEYEKRNPEFFNKVLETDPTLVVRVHAVTVLSEIGDESSVPVLANALKNDPSSLIRHECAFSLGQMGLKSAVPHLIEAALHDPSEIVRHESAAALGSIGDERGREALISASNDESEEVRGSALASLFNLDYLRQSRPRVEKLEESTRSKRTSRAKKRKMPHP